MERALGHLATVSLIAATALVLHPQHVAAFQPMGVSNPKRAAGAGRPFRAPPPAVAPVTPDTPGAPDGGRGQREEHGDEPASPFSLSRRDWVHGLSLSSLAFGTGGLADTQPAEAATSTGLGSLRDLRARETATIDLFQSATPSVVYINTYQVGRVRCHV